MVLAVMHVDTHSRVTLGYLSGYIIGDMYLTTGRPKKWALDKKSCPETMTDTKEVAFGVISTNTEL